MTIDLAQSGSPAKAQAIASIIEGAEARDPRIAFIIKLARALHRYGTATQRLERAMGQVLQRLGLNGNFFSTPTGIFASFGSPEDQRTSLIRAEPGEVDLEKLTLLDELAGQVIRAEVTASDGVSRVDQIVAAKSRYGAVLTAVCYGLASGASARFLGGGWREALAATIIGLILGVLSALVGRFEDASRIFEPIAALIAAALAVVAARLMSPISVYVTTLSGLIIFLPGLTLTTAMTELATRNLVSGTARLMGAVLILFEIGFGVALGGQVSRLLPAVPTTVEPLPLAGWTVWLALIIAPLAFVVLMRARPQDALWIIAACALSFGGARAGAVLLGPQLGVCVGAILVGAGSNLFARVTGRPSAVPLVPGIILLVPGSVGYGSFFNFIQRDVVSGVEAAFNMILIAVALVTGLLIANVIVPDRKGY